MRGTRAVVDRSRSKRQNLLSHALPIQHVDTRPSRQAGEVLGWAPNATSP